MRAAFLALGLLGGCHHRADSGKATGSGVDPRAFDAFYLWPGVRPPEGTKPKVLYLLDGEVRRAGTPVFSRLRPGSPHLRGVALWLVVRVERLDWNEETYRTILVDLARWQAARNRIVGLQVDFDARTRGIGGYARFLAGLRKRLPRQFQLSITGLMDWSANGDPRALAALHSVIDEVVVQTYQGRDTIPGYDAYFARMTHFPIPFRVALAQGGVWTQPPSLTHQPMFHGYVVFLIQKPAATPTVKNHHERMVVSPVVMQALPVAELTGCAHSIWRCSYPDRELEQPGHDLAGLSHGIVQRPLDRSSALFFRFPQMHLALSVIGIRARHQPTGISVTGTNAAERVIDILELHEGVGR